MLRVIIEEWEGEEALPALSRSEAHHLFKVRRLEKGEPVEVLNGRGQVGVGVFDGNAIRLESVEGSDPPPLPVHLAVAVPKGKSFPGLLQKAVELGASRVTPLLSDHVEVRAARLEGKSGRWETVLMEAVKQSGNPWKPKLDPPVPLGEFLEFPFSGKRLCAALQPDAINLWPVLEPLQANVPIQILIGPEGDFSAREYEALRSASCCFVSLGPLVLKVETAASLLLGAVSLRGRSL
jgi:16S rRNA (uracil1498-N3)-methyltransferase